MNCTDINTHIDEYLDGQLSAEDTLAFEEHTGNCDSCRKIVDDSKAMLSGLKSIEVPEPSINFESRVFSEVRRQHSENHRFKFAAGFSTAVAASLAIWFTSTFFIPGGVVDEPQVIAVAMNEVQTVRLMFDSETDFKQVSLSIDLPDNMQLDGYPERRVLAWETSLKKGQNILALPLMAIEQGQGELVARLNYGGKEKILRVVLSSTNDGVFQYQIDEIKSA